MRWFRIERVTWVERGLWVALVAVTVVPLALRPSPQEVARGYVEAVDRGDVDGALALTGDTIELFPPLGGGYFGREAARRVLEYRAALRERWRVIEWRFGYGSDEVVAVIETTNDVSALLGVQPRMEVLFRVQGARLVGELTLRDDRSLRRALRPVVEWAEADRPRELAAVWGHGRPIRSASSGRRLVALVGDWSDRGHPVATPAGSEQR